MRVKQEEVDKGQLRNATARQLKPFRLSDFEVRETLGEQALLSAAGTPGSFHARLSPADKAWAVFRAFACAATCTKTGFSR